MKFSTIIFNVFALCMLFATTMGSVDVAPITDEVAGTVAEPVVRRTLRGADVNKIDEETIPDEISDNAEEEEGDEARRQLGPSYACTHIYCRGFAPGHCQRLYPRCAPL